MKSEKGTYLCEECNITFKKALNYKMHMARHIDKLFHCPHCTLSFTRRIDLKEHMERCHTVIKRRLQCEHCHVIFTALSSLNRHMSITKCARQNSMTRLDICTGQSPKNRETRRMKSPKFHEEEYSQDPKSQEEKHAGQKNCWAKDTRENVKIQNKKTQARQKSLASQQDTGVFKMPEVLFGQKKMCIELKSYYCQQCRDTFPNQHSLNMHNQKFHQAVDEPSVKDNPYGLQPKVAKTPAGSPVTPRLYALKSKVAKKSTKSDGMHKSNTLQSTVVGKKAKSDDMKHTMSDGMNMKTEMGTTLKRFPCRQCKSTFTRNFNLKVHMQKHRRQTEQSQQNEGVVPVTGSSQFPEGVKVAGGTGEMSAVKLKPVEEPAKLDKVSLLESEQTSETASDSSPVKSSEENDATSNDVTKPKDEKDSSSDSQQNNVKRRSILKPFTCHYCNTSFIRQYSLKIHLMKHQKRADSEPKQQGHKQIDMPATDSRQLPAQSKSSDVKVKRRKVKSKHMKSTGSDRQSLSESEQKEGAVSDSVQIPDDITPGEESSKQNSTELSSVKHKGSAVHKREAKKSLLLKPFACHYCSTSFTRHYNLKVHMQKHEKQGSCESDQGSATLPDPTQLVNPIVHAGAGTVNGTGARMHKRVNYLKASAKTDKTQAFNLLAQAATGAVDSAGGRRHKKVNSEVPVEPTEPGLSLGYQNSDAVPEARAKESSIVDALKSKEAAISTKSEEMKIRTEGKSGLKSFACQHCSSSFTRYYNLQRHMERHDMWTDPEQGDAKVHFPDPNNSTKLVQSAYVTEKNDLGITESEENMQPMKANEQNACELKSVPDLVHFSASSKSVDENGEHQGTNSEDILEAGKTDCQNITPYDDAAAGAVCSTGGRMLKAGKKGRHSGDKPFSCEHCNVTFTTLYSLKRHTKKHEKQSDCEQNDVNTAADASEMLVNPVVLEAISTVNNGAEPKSASEEVCDSCHVSSDKNLESLVAGVSHATINSLVSKSVEGKFEQQGMKSSHDNHELNVLEHIDPDTTGGRDSHIPQSVKSDTKAVKPDTVKESEVASQFKKSDKEKDGSMVNESEKRASIAHEPENTGKSHVKSKEDQKSWLVQSSQSFEAWTSDS